MVVPLILIGVIILIGFIGNLIFKKTDIPNIIWLLFFGLALGPIFHIVDSSIFLSVSSFFAAIAIIIILFDGGLDMDLYKLFRDAPRGVMLTILAFTFSVLATTFVMWILGYPILQGILLGAIIGGISSPIVIPVVSKMKGVSEKTRTMLSIESAITDVICIVVAIIVMQAIQAGGANIAGALQTLSSAFAVGIIFGLVAGIAWIPIMHRIVAYEFSYVVTLAVLFLIYAGVEFMNGSGAVAVLIFGIVLGNGRKIFEIMKYSEKAFEIDQTTRQFHSLISFFIRTFFFVYLGLLVSITDFKFIILGIVLTFTLLAVRPIAVILATRGSEEITVTDKKTMSIMLPRGLAAAVLAYLPISMGLPMTEGFADIVFVVILGTALIATFGVVIIRALSKLEEKRGKAEEKKKEETQPIKKPRVIEVKKKKEKKI